MWIQGTLFGVIFACTLASCCGQNHQEDHLSNDMELQYDTDFSVDESSRERRSLVYPSSSDLLVSNRHSI